MKLNPNFFFFVPFFFAFFLKEYYLWYSLFIRSIQVNNHALMHITTSIKSRDPLVKVKKQNQLFLFLMSVPCRNKLKTVLPAIVDLCRHQF